MQYCVRMVIHDPHILIDMILVMTYIFIVVVSYFNY